jgi:hypothetical protein
MHTFIHTVCNEYSKGLSLSCENTGKMPDNQ